jgi:putative flippase GtrA
VGQPLKVAAFQGLATLVDFAVASAIVYNLRAHPSAATVAGCVVGAGVSFISTRVWAFDSHGAWLPQVGRYAFVSAGTAALNGGGVALLATLNAPFWLAWGLTRAIVFATWSYPLQRDFVFMNQDVLPTPEEPVASRP